MKFSEIKQLIEMLNESNIMEFKMKEGEFELSVRSKEYNKLRQPSVIHAPAPAFVNPAPAAVSPAAPAPAASGSDTDGSQDDAGGEDQSNLVAVKSPIVGTFYRSSSPDKPAFVKVGDTISKGQVVCIVEAMKLFNEIESEVAGKIVKVEVDDASPVEYDKVLFWVSPA